MLITVLLAAATAATGATTALPPTACDTATGPRLRVGPGQTYAVPSQAAAAAGNGAVVLISAGDYSGDVASWPQDNLTLCGAGGRARLFADGRHAAGKGIWVISGSNVTVDSVEFHGARVPHRNGAGIRAEGQGLRIVNAGFFDNENGILGPNAGTLEVSRSEFARNGVGEPGRTHSLYAGTADAVTVSASFFHAAVIGHQLKSRARATRVSHSHFMDGPDGTASYQIDVPNGGIVELRGNLLQKGPRADNPVAVSFGAEGLASGIPHTLTLVHNTLASTYEGGSFLSVPAGVEAVQLQGNVFAGNGASLYKDQRAVGPAFGSAGNVLCAVTGLPAPDDIASPGFWPTAAGGCRRTLSGTLSGTRDRPLQADAPRPLLLRPLATGPHVAGALQAPP